MSSGSLADYQESPSLLHDAHEPYIVCTAGNSEAKAMVETLGGSPIAQPVLDMDDTQVPEEGVMEAIAEKFRTEAGKSVEELQVDGSDSERETDCRIARKMAGKP